MIIKVKGDFLVWREWGDSPTLAIAECLNHHNKVLLFQNHDDVVRLCYYYRLRKNFSSAMVALQDGRFFTLNYNKDAHILYITGCGNTSTTMIGCEIEDAY